MLKSIYLPPDETLTDYYAIEDAIMAQVRENEDETERLAELRDALLPRLMSGELSALDLGDSK
jgi:type I restriction enzyme S subunit